MFISREPGPAVGFKAVYIAGMRKTRCPFREIDTDTDMGGQYQI
jgi:hypothetical protein